LLLKRALSIIALILLGLTGCGPKEDKEVTDSGFSRYKELLQKTGDDRVSDPVYSGYKEVFENRDLRQGRRIRIFITVIPARSDSVLSPIFHFEGGPGQPANSAISYYEAFPELSEHRDIVLIDARGTGNSNGLYCSAFQFDPRQPAQAFEEMFPLNSVSACLEELKGSVDLSQYSTANIVEDVEEIREWLGYDKVNLIGFSYGTRVIESYLRRHPGSVRSAIMGGPAPAAMHRPASFAKDSQQAWDLICRDCAADPDCASRYPQLNSELNSVMTRLNTPVNYRYRDPTSGVEEDIVVTRGVIAECIRTIMYSTNGQRRLPSMVHQAANGNFGPLVDRTISRSLGYNSLSDALFLCISCSEDIPFVDTLDRVLTAGTFLSDYRIRRETKACAQWPRHPFNVDQTEPVVTDVPVLIISGSHDPVTPPRWATVMSAGMTSASLVTVEHMAHSGYGLSNPECLTNSYAAFFDKPKQGVQMPCAAEMRPGAFR
jgi:pimeloyl-ACP methyl ester carboxylesterase